MDVREAARRVAEALEDELEAVLRPRPGIAEALRRAELLCDRHGWIFQHTYDPTLGDFGENKVEIMTQDREVVGRGRAFPSYADAVYLALAAALEEDPA